ncbi:hypothetical protein ACF0H5_008179 [Mactra antiquata]
MRSLRRQSKCMKGVIVVCICGCLLIGLRLLGKAHSYLSFTSVDDDKFSAYDRNKGVRHLKLNPHNILPAFMHRFIPATNITTTVPDKASLNSDLKIVTKYPSWLHRSFDTPASHELSYQVHTFYYPWYGNPELDGKYYHWNHPHIPHWNKNVAKQYPNYTHRPPDDVGSNYYPLLGAYSSNDPEVIDLHMKMMRYAKIGVVVVSWYPPNDADNEGREPDAVVPYILDAADKYNLKVALHVEPYKGRNASSMKQNLKYIINKYGNHSAFYRTNFKQKRNLPLIYIYDSYLVSAQEWAKILKSFSIDTVRSTELDAIFIGLLVESGHKDHLVKSGFDGFYTYFATNSFTYGSTWKSWPEFKEFSIKMGLMFIPSVGPGYIDTEIRPWNSINTRKRLEGRYYDESFKNAISVKPNIISITSFNEWHEGTQIEPAEKKIISSRKYMDYGKKGPNHYLDLTRQWVDNWVNKN